MKRFLPLYIKYLYSSVFVFGFMLLMGWSALGQTPGLIIKPAAGGEVSPLDPDGDGYVSKRNGGVQLGFTTPPGNDVIQSEIPYVALVKPDLRGDLLRGPIGGFTEIVGTDEEGNNAILTYTDGVNLFYRFRLSGYAPNSKSYSILIDTDGKMGFTGPNADPNALSGNPGFEVEIVLHSNFDLVAYLVDGTTTPVQIPGARYPYSTHCQKSIAVSTDGNDPDYFYDFYLPFTGLPFTNASLLRYVAVTTMNPNPATGNNAVTDIGGAGADTNLDQVFTNLVNAQTPTAPGQEILERSGCPTISGPLSNGATAVSGTSTEEGGTIKLYVNDVIVGTTPVSNGEWTISNLSGLNGGSSIKATVKGLGKGESSSECNLTFVGFNCSPMPSIAPIDNGDKGVRVSNVSTYPAGTVFTVYSSGGNIWENDSKTDNNPFTIAEATAGTIDIGCGGTGNCMIEGSYYVVAQAPFQCESPRAYFCIGGTAGTTTVSPAVNAITPFSSFITGTGGISGATIMIYAAGTYIGTKILTVSGTWSVPVSPSLICNTTISAQQIAPGLCLSAPSNVVNVGSFVTSAPAINVDKCATSITTVNGFSGESDGTTIEVFVNGTSSGTTTVANGAWSLSTTAISIGQLITARATNTSGCKTVSALSPAVSLVGKTALSGTFSIASVVSEGAASVPVTVSGTSGTYTLNLYIDGDKIGSVSFSADGIVNVPVTFLSDIYTGGELTVSLTSLAQCESLPTGPLATVQCKMPNFASSIIDAAVTDKCITTSGTITVTNSQLMVIYTPVNDMGVVTGYSALGNGATITLSTFPLSATGPSVFYVKAQGIGSSVSCSATSSESVSFNGYSSPQFITQPVGLTVCSGIGITSTTSWTGTGPYNVQWQYDSGSGWFNLSESSIFSQTSATGTTNSSSTLTINDVTFLDQYLFRCIVSDLGIPAECQVSTSNTSLLNVISVTISSAIITNATSGNNGAIDITVSGGNGPYTYDWYHIDGAGTFGPIDDLTDLTGGVYTVTVRDANGCTHTQTMTVGGVGSINLANVSQTNITCYGANNGELEVIATEGTGPYTYSINNLTPQSSGIFTDLAPGIYTVRAKDSNQAESNTVLVTITEPLEMVVFASVSNPSVVLNDGSVNITLGGGTTPVTYSLYQTPSSLISTVSNSGLRNLSFTNLTYGTYYIEVTDANGCFTSKQNIVLTNPIITTDNCEKVASHSFNFPQNNYSGYDGSYNFFSPNVWTETGDPSNRIQIQEEALAFGLIPAYNGAGNNAVTLTGNPSISRSIDLTGVSPATVTVSFKYTIRYPSANDDYRVRLYVNNVISPFSFHQASGEAKSASITLSNGQVNFISGINTFKFELYQVVNNNKFQAQSNFLLDDFVILFSKAITTAITTTPSTCGHGTIALSVVGGYPPYTYTSDLPIDATGSFTSTKNWEDLEDGTYHITITDALNCATSQKTVVIDSAPLVGAITEATDPTCLGGGSNGTLTATLSELGTGGPYTYDLFKASVLISSIVSAGTSKIFTGLAPGSYFVKITQGNGNCKTQTSSVTLSLPSLTSSIASNGATTICNGSSTTVAVTVTGGTAPYTVTLSNGLIINNYTSGTDITVIPYSSVAITVTSVTDAINCASSSNTGSVAITVIPMPEASFGYLDSPYCSNNANPSPTFNGAGVAGLFSSTSGLVFVSSTTGQIDLLASTPGTYIITNTITGGGGCGIVTATSPVTIIADGSWTGALSTDWNNPGNWACNQVPTLASNVLIANGKPHYPILSAGDEGAANSMIIESAGSLTVTGNRLQIAGAISNEGNFNASAGTIEMKGTAAQTIGANVFAGNSVMNLRIDNAAGVTLQGALNVTGIVTAVNGNLTSGGNLTLVSTATQTALIDGIGAGNVLGNVNMQRYLPSAFGYKYFSSPFQAATVAELSEEVDLGATFPSFYKYDENNSIDSSGVMVYKSGWVKYNLAGNALVPLVGYAANLGANIAAPAIIANMTGVVNDGNLQVSLDNHNRKYTKGFNLVGNPYPSPIDWNATGWIKVNIDNALYFFNTSGSQYAGIYSSYVNGVSTGNGSNVIAALQGFFVHVSNGTYPVNGTLGVTNSVRINNLNPVFKRAVIDNRSTLRLTASFEHKNAMEDAAVIYFDNAANLDFDQDLDALKMTNTDLLVPNIYSLSPELNQLSINGMPKPSDDISKVSLGITTFTDGWITLTADDISRLPADLHIYLLDAETGLQRNLRQLPDYRFYLKSGQYNGRFSLVFSQSKLSEQVGTLAKLFTILRSGDYLSVKANLPDNTRGSLMVTNLLGQIILRKEVNGNETLELNPTVHTGLYVITLVSGKLKHSEKVIMRKDYE